MILFEDHSKIKENLMEIQGRQCKEGVDWISIL